MLPSKKIGIGASLLVTGVLLEILAGQLPARFMETLGPIQGGGPGVAAAQDGEPPDPPDVEIADNLLPAP